MMCNSVIRIAMGLVLVLEIAGCQKRPSAAPIQELVKAIQTFDAETVSLLAESVNDIDEMSQFDANWTDAHGAFQSSTYRGTPLHLAVFTGDLAIVQILLDTGASLQMRTEQDGYDALDIAVMTGQAEVVQLLLDSGANPATAGPDGSTALHMAVAFQRMSIATRLIASGAAVNAQDQHGLTPLHLAAFRDDSDITELLISNGARVDVPDTEGDGPLHHAAYYGSFEAAQLLLQHGADASSVNEDGKTPLDHAIEREHQSLVRLLNRLPGSR
ncbi:MAG: ankyrin repeat domain-containing protein [Phycisphaerales bacterium]|nr:MAG: ankyrin repeat domain-containing protein [Phycisphaerales bacterium]